MPSDLDVRPHPRTIEVPAWAPWAVALWALGNAVVYAILLWRWSRGGC